MDKDEIIILIYGVCSAVIGYVIGLVTMMRVLN